MTAATAAVLLVLLAVEGVTVVFLRPLLTVHVFVGMLLIPPVALKLASTGYRFACYYGGRRAYLRKGPPQPLLRLLAPVVVASTVVLFSTGVVLAVAGPPSGFVLPLHKASFVIWLAVTGVHVLGHISRIPRLASGDWRRADRLPGRRARVGVVGGALLAGVVIALVTLPLAAPWARVFR